jgi:hypothetical protein
MFRLDLTEPQCSLYSQHDSPSLERSTKSVLTHLGVMANGFKGA